MLKTSKKCMIVLSLICVYVIATYSLVYAGWPVPNVAWWSFDELSGDVAYDSVDGHDGQLSNIGFTDGVVDGAYNFEGPYATVTSSVTVPAQAVFDFTADFTFTAWIKVHSTPNSYYYILAAKNNYGESAGWIFNYMQNGEIRWDTYPNSNTQTSVPVPLNTWTHLAFSYNGFAKRIYINGLLVKEDVVVPTLTNDAPLTFGTVTNMGDRPEWRLDGQLDDVRVYDHALAEAEIQGLYQEQFTPEELIAELIRYVVSLNFQQGISNALDAKLDTAITAISDMNNNNNIAAINSLNAFINSVQAQSGNKITAEDAEVLIDSANAIIAKLTAQ